jgi:hypothetical protein
MSLIELHTDPVSNPVDVIEHVAALEDWTFERSGDHEITITTPGQWCDYHLSFSWMEPVEALHLACAFDLKITDPRRAEILRLLALVNEQAWLGHFDLWSEEGVVMYRYALLLPGGLEPTVRQVETMMQGAVEACERYYQAFQFVVWAGKSAQEALELVMFETAGEA